MDVKLLGQATVRYMASMEEATGIHPVDVAKYTASSFSSTAVQMHLYKNKNVATFSPTAKPTYHWLKSSCLGGICQVSR